MKLVKGIALIIHLIFASSVLFQSFVQTDVKAHTAAFHFEAEEKSENSSEEEELHYVDFENNYSKDSFLWYSHLTFYSSSYTFSIEVPPEYLLITKLLIS